MYEHDIKPRCTDIVKRNQSFPNVITLVCPFDRNVEPSDGSRLRSVLRPINTQESESLSVNLTACDWAVTADESSEIL